MNISYVLGTARWHILVDGRKLCHLRIDLDFAMPGTAEDVERSEMLVCKRCETFLERFKRLAELTEVTTATYRVTFDRIGRHHDIAPMEFEAVTDPDELAALICQRSKSYLTSRNIDVLVNLKEMTGGIYTGGRPAGRCTIEEIT